MSDDRYAELRTAIDDVLHDPLKLRVAVALLLIVAWYLAALRPLGGRIAEQQATLQAERERLALAREIEHLRAEDRRFRDRLPEGGDRNEWVSYLVEGIRDRLPGRPVSIDPADADEVGPYQAAAVRIEAEGQYRELEDFLRWIEGSPRMLRADVIQLDNDERARPDASGRPVMRLRLVVKGVVG